LGLGTRVRAIAARSSTGTRGTAATGFAADKDHRNLSAMLQPWVARFGSVGFLVKAIGD
jgi:hypothetical protein